MGTMTLRAALNQFEGEILSDGAQDWDQDNLREAIEQDDTLREAIEQDDTDDDDARELGYVLLDDQVYVDESGIRTIKTDGYLGEYIYTVTVRQS